MKRLSLIIFAAIATCCIFSACRFNLGSISYKIDFIVDGEIYHTASTDGSVISMPKDPKKENFTFGGWFWDDGEWDKPFTVNSILDQP